MDVNDSFDPAPDSNERRRVPDPNAPIGTRRKGKNNPDRNRIDEELSSDEIDEQIPAAAESAVDSLGGKSSLPFCISYTLLLTL